VPIEELIEVRLHLFEARLGRSAYPNGRKNARVRRLGQIARKNSETEFFRRFGTGSF
jgi:hypothetical protein